MTSGYFLRGLEQAPQKETLFCEPCVCEPCFWIRQVFANPVFSNPVFASFAKRFGSDKFANPVFSIVVSCRFHAPSWRFAAFPGQSDFHGHVLRGSILVRIHSEFMSVPWWFHAGFMPPRDTSLRLWIKHISMARPLFGYMSDPSWFNAGTTLVFCWIVLFNCLGRALPPTLQRKTLQQGVTSMQ